MDLCLSVGFGPEEDSLYSAVHQHVGSNVHVKPPISGLRFHEFVSLGNHFNLSLSTLRVCWICGVVKSVFGSAGFEGWKVADLSSGKLLVYASRFGSCENRLKPVSEAAERMADLLKMGVEVKTFKKKFKPIFVYYKQGDEEPVPLYCNSGEESNVEDVYVALRNMMFVLSFHPKNLMLRHARKEIMQFS